METREVFTDETVQSLIELGRQTAGPQAIQRADGIPFPFIIVKGAVKPLPELVFNDHAKQPERVKANVGVLDPQSFCEYYTLFADKNSRVFADESVQRVQAVLDYHVAGADGTPRWGQHRLTLTLRQSEEWKAWIGRNNKGMTQQEFAEFLEQNAVDIINPSSAAIREIAEDLEVTVDVDFASAQKMAGGKVNFKYTETTKTTVSGGKQITVPDQFVISIPAFVGGQRVQMQALLRYRVKEQKLSFFYTLIRPEEVIRQAFIAARDGIADSIQVNIINGVPA
jgi:uncharacterized protein YfdQ (DUF2303 family)